MEFWKSGKVVSIPLRKVSRRYSYLEYAYMEYRFHPSKEGFKDIIEDSGLAKPVSFHPSKEGFKVLRLQHFYRYLKYVSIPLRKVSRRFWNIRIWNILLCFHPSKEGFKGVPVRIHTVNTVEGFHPSKEGFKEEWDSRNSQANSSFHPSKEGFKVFRQFSPFQAVPGFHPSKEGFKDCLNCTGNYRVLLFPSL